MMLTNLITVFRTQDYLKNLTLQMLQREILTPGHVSKHTFTTPSKRTKLLSGNLNALNFARIRFPSSVRKFSNKYGSIVHLKLS